MSDYQLLPGGEEWLERVRRPSEDVFLEATEGDDFIGVQTYTRMRVGSRRLASDRQPGCRPPRWATRCWPEALEATIRRATGMTGLPVYVTENGIGTDDDDQRIEFVARRARRGRSVPRRRHRRAGLLLLEPARQLRVGARLRADLRSGRGGPVDLRAPPEAEFEVARWGGARQYTHAEFVTH